MHEQIHREQTDREKTHQGMSGRESLRHCELKTCWFHPVCCRGSFLPYRALVVEASSLSLLLCGLWVWARSPPVCGPGDYDKRDESIVPWKPARASARHPEKPGAESPGRFANLKNSGPGS